MRGNASNLFADVLMNDAVDKPMEITSSQYKSFVFYRYDGDSFSIFNDKKSDNEFEKISNSIIHRKITFTTEMQSIIRLSFLDVLNSLLSCRFKISLIDRFFIR